MNAKAKYNSVGFRKKYWEKGEVAENITEAELKLPEMKHFELSGQIPKSSETLSPNDDLPDDDSPVTLSEFGNRQALEQYTKAQLIEKLQEKKVEVPTNLNKEKLIDMCIKNGAA